MGGWIDGWIDGWMDEGERMCENGWMVGLVHVYIDVCMYDVY